MTKCIHYLTILSQTLSEENNQYLLDSAYMPISCASNIFAPYFTACFRDQVTYD